MASLFLKFQKESDYKKAIGFFETESSFQIEDEHYEFHSLEFMVKDEEDANFTERDIDNELIGIGIEDYGFEFQERTEMPY